jgi:hypothetical protein
VGAAVWVRFIYYYVVSGGVSGHIQSLIIGTGFSVLSFVVALVAMLAELLAANRRLLEDLLVRMRRIESREGAGTSDLHHDGIRTTRHPAWKPIVPS